MGPTLPVWASVATRLLVCAALAFAAFFVPTPFAAAESHGSHDYTYDSHTDADTSAPDTVDVAWPSGAASRSLANGVVRHVYDHARSLVAPTSALDDLAQSSGILRNAARGKGNFGIGSSTAAHADELGQAWVGAGFRRSSSNPDILVSADGLRQYRPPSYKPNQGGYQANFEWRNVDAGQWQGNGHLDISDLATDLGG